MNQYEWLRSEDNSINFCYSESELDRRADYLNRIDTYVHSKNNWKLEELFDEHYTRRIASLGPGSGKTTKLRQFCVDINNYEKGIIVAVRTILEAKILAYDIVAMNRDILVALWTSGSEVASKVNADPTYVSKFDIVITTHQRIIMECPSLLFNTTNGRSYLGSIGRQYLILDEYPKFYNNCTVNNFVTHFMSLTGLTPMDYESNDELLDKMRRIESKVYDSIDNLLLSGTNLSNQMLSSLTKDALDRKGFNELLIERLKFYFALQLQNLRRASPEERFEDDFKSLHSITSFLNNHILVLDGTGDMIINGSYWDVITRYHSDVQYSVYRPDITASLDDLDKTVQEIERLCQSHNKLLILCRKNNNVTKEVTLQEVEFTHTVITESNEYPTIIMNKLSEYAKSKVYITYYQSGETRATSKFSDADAILYLGKWSLPNSTVAEFNTITQSVGITTEDYTLAEMKQCLYRTAVRHSSPVTIYFSADIASSTIRKLLANITLSRPEVIEVLGIETKYINMQIEMINLLSAFPVINNEVKVDLDTLFVIAPRDRKDRYKYNPLVKLFTVIGITLIIE